MANPVKNGFSKPVALWQRPGLANFAGIFLICYFLALMPLRYVAQGPSALFEMLWACNVALVICGLGCLLRSPILIGSAISLVAFPHLSWNLDVIVYFLAGFFPFGTASYVIWPTTHPIIIATTLHHVWMIPLAFAVLRGNAGLPSKLVLYSCSYVLVLASLCRVVTPLTYDGVYLNVNMAHEWWKDSEGDFFHQFDKAHPVIYVAYGVTIANTFNSVSFFVFKAIYDLFVNRGVAHKLKVH